MYIVKETINCKPGKVREIVTRFKNMTPIIQKMGYKPFRILTDVSGDKFWTVVTITEVETIDQFFSMMEKGMANEELGKVMAGYHDFVISGSREIYKVEA